MKKQRKKYIFSGRVQGVGFRWRARQIAGGLGLTGWVKNLWDGTVEMEVQGEPREIQRLLVLLYQQSFIRIEGLEERELPLETETGFHIR